jgi:mono/diheme cytochrome c family protein
MRPSLQVLIAAFAVLLSGCDARTPSRSPGLAAVRSVRLPEGDLAGGFVSPRSAAIENPVAGDAAAIADGKRLFTQMNCAGCHGYDLGGSMGPNLADAYWRYGGSPAAIYQSIAAGHPQGMPAWSAALPPSEIWKIVAYIQSYGGATPAGAYQAALQGDTPPRATSPGGGTGAHAGAKGGTAASAQSANP